MWLISNALMTAYANLHCSPGAAAASSPGKCSDGNASAPSNSNQPPLAYYSHGKTKAILKLSRYGITSSLLTENHGEALLTWFRAGFPVWTYPVQDNEPELTAKPADSGRKWRGSLAKYDPSTHSLKMPQTSLFADLLESCVTLPRWGLMRNGEIFPHPQLERDMKGCAPGYLLPTLTVQGNGKRSSVVSMTGITDAGEKRNMNLDTAMNLLPTLTVNGNHNRAGLSEKSGDGLQTKLNLLPTLLSGESTGKGHGRCLSDKLQLLPTLSATELDRGTPSQSRNPKTGKLHQKTLMSAIKTLPTLCATDWKGSYSKEGYQKQKEKRSKPLRDTLVHETGFRLTPGFAEWFMGWPIGWTMLPDGKENKTARIKILGNGQVPLCAVWAFEILNEHAKRLRGSAGTVG